MRRILPKLIGILHSITGSYRRIVDVSSQQGSMAQMRRILDVRGFNACVAKSPKPDADLSMASVGFQVLTGRAVDHWDTDNPHTHVVLRGRHARGRPPSYPVTS